MLGQGFDGVETDLDETFDGNEGKSGFKISQAGEEKYLTTLADYMHGLGLAWIAKNLDDTERASFVDTMEPLAQGIVSEQCNQYDTCSYLHPFLAAGKWVGNAEYSKALSQFAVRQRQRHERHLFQPEPRRRPQPLPLNGRAPTKGHVPHGRRALH